MSLFRKPSSQSVGAGAHQRRRRKSGPPADREKLERFAEALSWHDIGSGNFGGNVSKVSAALGISHQRGSQLLAKIKAELGWQAQ